MGNKYDFSGWATRNDLLCADGRTIRKNAFKDNDGSKVPLVWNHNHGSVKEVLGHALLKNREDGVYAYCSFNDTESGKAAKKLVQHGDVNSLSIYANNLKQIGGDVIHGSIRELSLVLSGANPGATIDFVMAHGEDGEESITGFEACYNEGPLVLYHSEDEPEEDEIKEEEKEEPEDMGKENQLVHADKNEKTVAEVFDELTEEQKTVVYAMIGQALEDSGNISDEDEDGGSEKMAHNLFENEQFEDGGVLTHSDEMNILDLAKQNNVGSLQLAMDIYSEENDHLAHALEASTFGGDVVGELFPEYRDVKPGAPELISRDQSWVSRVMSGTHKSPISRIRTRQVDIRDNDLRALGYKKGDKKAVSGAIKMIKRTTDPQTVYRKDSLHRDDIVDITDFSVVDYQYGIMKQNLNEEIATAILIGDGREDVDENKIHEDHIRSIWNDDELYTIHTDVDIAAAKAELQGTGTGANFGDNYVYAEAIITAALYSREKYKGSGSLDFYCTPHLLNVMLLARDINGRRIYTSKADLAAALNVNDIITVEQFENKVRVDSESKKHKLLGLFVNLSDYQVGCTKGGEITRFEQFDIDFNQHKYLIETRISGALTKVFSAIALEEPVATP